MHGDSSKHNKLGRGMGSLLSGFDYDAQIENVLSELSSHPSKDGAEGAEEKVLQVSIDNVRPNPNQPRKNFDEDALGELAESIKTQGVIQPLIVEEYAPGKYSIVAGERRYRASSIAGLKTVPVIVKSLSEVQRIEISLIENVQREDLNPIEEAYAYQYLIQKSGYTQEQVAEKVGKSRSAVANALRLISLPDSIKDDVTSGLITPGHARAILSLVNPADQMLLRNKIVEEDLNVRDSEALAEEYNKGRKVVKKKKEAKKDTEILMAEQKFNTAIGAKCEIKGTLNRGRLLVRFRNQKELERIYAFLSNGEELFED